MIATAWAKLSEENFGFVGICNTISAKETCSLVKPDFSLPNIIPILQLSGKELKIFDNSIGPQ